MLHDLSALAQVGLIGSGDLSALELVNHYLSRIDRLDPSIGSFAAVESDKARADARAVHARPMDSDQRPLPLLGSPIAFTDLTSASGRHVSYGSRAFSGSLGFFDSDVVSNVLACGAINVGATAASEFGLMLSVESEYSEVRNPWALEMTAGGSSGGAAAAVAAGLIPWAQGSDGGGSLRVPAALCGLVGFKPSRGLVSHGPMHSGMFGLPSNGPITRSVRDAAALLDAMSAPRPGEPYLWPGKAGHSYLRNLTTPRERSGAARLRIARQVEPSLTNASIDPQIADAVETVTATIKGLGHVVTDIESPFEHTLGPIFDDLAAILAANPIPSSKKHLLERTTLMAQARAESFSARDLLALLGEMQSVVRKASQRTDDFDIIFTPTTAEYSAHIGMLSASDDPFERQRRFSPFCAPYNMTGQPAVTLPAAQTANGLPIGMQFAAKPGFDNLLLQFSFQLETELQWANRHPPQWYV